MTIKARYGSMTQTNPPPNLSVRFKFVSRSKFVKRYNYSGNPNIRIELSEPLGSVNSIVIGVDNAEHFISASLDSASRHNN